MGKAYFLAVAHSRPINRIVNHYRGGRPGFEQVFLDSSLL